MEIKVNAIRLHIKHSKPIEVGEFVSTINAMGNLYSYYVQNKGFGREYAKSKLYVQKIKEGSIDIILTELVSSGIIPFCENAIVLYDFALYIKRTIEFFTEGKGEKPNLCLPEIKAYRDLMGVTANDNHGETTIGAINSQNMENLYLGCTFNFQGSNSAQNQLEKEEAKIKEIQTCEQSYTRVLMTIFQLRSDMSSDKGNKAVIEKISKKRLPVVFETDNLKRQILNSDDNPTKMGYFVDVEILMASGMPAAYKVTALHDVLPLDDAEE